MADVGLTPAARTALAHYENQAAHLRRVAAAKRARAAHLDDVTRLTLMRHADDLDTQAAEWEALATELKAFADTQAEPPTGETLL